MPKEVGCLRLTTLREKLLKIGAKTTRYGRHVSFQLTEITILKSERLLPDFAALHADGPLTVMDAAPRR